MRNSSFLTELFDSGGWTIKNFIYIWNEQLLA